MPLPGKIFLIGFMGSGKSHWGHIWAGQHGVEFFDLDTCIEETAKMTVAEIFEKQGEEKFRKMEHDHLRIFQNKKNFLLACGGGTPCFDGNMQWMKTQGTVIYLKAMPETILKYVKNEQAGRPLIKDMNPAELLLFIQKKLAEREPFYLQANFVLNVEALNKDSLWQLLNKTTNGNA